MTFFEDDDIAIAAHAIFKYSEHDPKKLAGIMSGFQRRARTQAILTFAKAMNPPAPDSSIATMRMILCRLFGRSVSNNDLHQNFATIGRTAADRVDVIRLFEWYSQNEAKFRREADALLLELKNEGKQFRKLARKAALELQLKMLDAQAGI